MESQLERLAEKLKCCSSDSQRIEELDQEPSVAQWVQESSLWKRFSANLRANAFKELIVKSLVAVGQQDHLLWDGDAEKLERMLEDLSLVETFYRDIGGIVGYHWVLCSSLRHKDKVLTQGHYHRPPGVDISVQNDAVARYILKAIVCLPQLAEIYPVGGAADRLKFCDPMSGQPLPAAKLQFCGHTLFREADPGCAGQGISLFQTVR